VTASKNKTVLIEIIESVSHLRRLVYDASTADEILEMMCPYFGRQYDEGIKGLRSSHIASALVRLSHIFCLMLLCGFTPGRPAVFPALDPMTPEEKGACEVLDGPPTVAVSGNVDFPGWGNLINVAQKHPEGTPRKWPIDAAWFSSDVQLIWVCQAYLVSMQQTIEGRRLVASAKGAFLDLLTQVLIILRNQLHATMATEAKVVSGVSTAFLTFVTWLFHQLT